MLPLEVNSHGLIGPRTVVDEARFYSAVLGVLASPLSFSSL